MKTTGGVVHSEWTVEERKDSYGEAQLIRRASAVVWGTMTTDAESHTNNTRKGKRNVVSFRIRLKRKQFIRCTVYQNSPFFETAQNLRAGDSVLVAGPLTAWTYTKRGDTEADDERKISLDLYPLFILPQSLLQAAGVCQQPDPVYGADYDPTEFEDEPPENDRYDTDRDGDAWNPF